MGGQDGRVPIREHGEVVALDVEKGEDDVFPAILENHAAPFGEAVLGDGVGGVDEVEEDVIEEGLEGRDGGAFHHQQGGEGVGAGDADGEDLAEPEDEPEVAGAEVGEFGFPGFVLDRYDRVFFGGLWQGAVVDFWERLVANDFWCGAMGDFWKRLAVNNLWRVPLIHNLRKAMAGVRPVARSSRSGARVDARGTDGSALGAFDAAHGGKLCINRSMLLDTTDDSVIGALCRLASAKLLKSLAVEGLLWRCGGGEGEEELGSILIDISVLSVSRCITWGGVMKSCDHFPSISCELVLDLRCGVLSRKPYPLDLAAAGRTFL